MSQFIQEPPERRGKGRERPWRIYLAKAGHARVFNGIEDGLRYRRNQQRRRERGQR